MNKVMLCGNICKDFELRKTPNGNSVVINTVAVTRNYKDAGGNYESDFINFVAWGSTAEYLANYAKKGDRAELVGRWQVRQYTDKNNATQTVNEVVVESINVINRTPKEEKIEVEPKYSAYDLGDDDLPF